MKNKKTRFLDRLGMTIIWIGMSAFLFACASKPSRPDVQIPQIIKATPTDYCLLSADYKAHINFLHEYRLNSTRLFAYCGWTGYIPWDGRSMANLRQDHLDRLRDLVNHANERGIVPILTLFQDNGGGGTENVTSRNGAELAEYIKKTVEALKDLKVIYETINENQAPRFQDFVLNELKKYGVATMVYWHPRDSTFYRKNVLSKKYIGGNAVHSNDVAGYDRYYSDDDYIRIIDQSLNGKGFELLVHWRNGELNLDQIRERYGRVLEHIKGLP